MKDSTKRFSDRVDNYQRFRPSYPDKAIEYLFDNFGLSKKSVIADIGSGTGIFTEKLLPKCRKVYAVEPNLEMRTAAEERLKINESFQSINGTSENTTLDSNSIDAITVAQAFHWFNIEETQKEFKRILSKDAVVFLIWNKRIINTPFLKAYEEILVNRIPEYTVVNHNSITEDIIKKFLIRDYLKKMFQNNQIFNLDGVLGRLSSSSYTPKQNTKEYRKVKEEIAGAFNQYSNNGVITFDYNTEIYSGKIS